MCLIQTCSKQPNVFAQRRKNIIFDFKRKYILLSIYSLPQLYYMAYKIIFLPVPLKFHLIIYFLTGIFCIKDQ